MNPRNPNANKEINASNAYRQYLANRRGSGQPQIAPAVESNNASLRARQARINQAQSGIGKQQVEATKNATDRDHDKRLQVRRQKAQEGQ